MLALSDLPNLDCKYPDDHLNFLVFSLLSSNGCPDCGKICFLLSFENKNEKWRILVPYDELEMTTHGKILDNYSCAKAKQEESKLNCRVLSSSNGHEIKTVKIKSDW